MADELIDILSPKGIPTGEIYLKSKAHKLGLYHSSVHIWLYTMDKKVLIQKRSKNKDIYPGLWDVSVAGHIASGEAPKNAAIREIKEEIGISIPYKELKFIKRYLAKKRPTVEIIDNEFHHIYISKLVKAELPFKLQEEEVEELKYISIESFINDINDPIKKLEYVPHAIDYYQLIYNTINGSFTS